MTLRFLIAFLFITLIFSCSEKRSPEIKSMSGQPGKSSLIDIDPEIYRDKVLGLLIGSAIGDAMGAPTEMWGRNDIQLNYGFVEKLDTMVRPPSAEGTWKHNLPAGGTTDDTRWKVLLANYLVENRSNFHKPASFARFILNQYLQKIDELKRTEGFEPGPYEENLMKMAWLQEWALVARPFAENDLPGYARALSKFYGGEMTCAGMLYAPMLAIPHPADPENAYRLAYDLGIFDIGYARDMTGLVSAMTSAGFDPKATPESILNVNRITDPEKYFESRLVGRSAYRFYQYARQIKYQTDTMTLKGMVKKPAIHKSMQHLDTLEYLKLMKAYEMLDQANEDIAFHPGEIYLITLTALMHSDFDFKKCMRFIVNYGRDNDTVAAIAGAILGAYWGAGKLPADMSAQVLMVNKEVLEIDLEQVCDRIVEAMK